MNGKLRELERMSGEIAYYWSSDIPALLGEDTPSFSTFRRRVQEGKIHTVDIGGRETAFNAEDVQLFVAGKLTKPRGGAHRTKRNKHTIALPGSVVPQAHIALAGEDDFLHLYLRESDQIGYIHAIAPPILHAWSGENNLLSWFSYTTGNKTDVTALLTLLPLPETTIQRLLSGEISFGQIPPNDILSYNPGEHYSAIIVSAAAKVGQQDNILLLARRAFSDLARHSILIDNLYALADEQDDSPLMRIITYCAFTPIDESGKQWRLRPFYRKFQPASFIREYRSFVLNDERKLKNMLLTDTTPDVTVIGALRDFFNKEKQVSDARQRDLTEVLLKRITIEPDGRIVQIGQEQRKQRNVFVRPIQNDHDIEDAMLINASLFGASKRFTLPQLVDQRRPWITKNPDTYRVLEIDGRVIGYVFILPLPQPVLQRLLEGTTLVGDISVDDLQTYQAGEEYNLFLHTLGIHKSIQDTAKRWAGFYLLAGMYKLFTDLGRRGIRISNLYTRSNEFDGVNWAAAFGLDEITVPGVENKLVMRLDFSDPTKTSLQAYREALAEYEGTTKK
jgi:hypothetical protein